MPEINLPDFVKALNGGLTVIDSRNTAMHKSGHIPGTLNIEAKDFAQRLPSDKDAAIVLYCSGDAVGCKMYQQGAAKLRKMGYKNISHWGGGLHEWQKRRAPVASGVQVVPKGVSYHEGTAYHIQVPEVEEGQKLGLLLWCHPSDGNPTPEFNFLKSSKIFSKQNGDVILVAPQAHADGWSVERDGAAMEKLLKHLVATYDIDPQRVALGGHSAGGHFTYNWGLSRQETFTALFPRRCICNP